MRKKTKPILLLTFLIIFILFVALPAQTPGEEHCKKEENKHSTPSPTEMIARYAAQAKLSDYPPEVIERAKHLILDNIGCILGGTQTPTGKKYLRIAQNRKGKGMCTIPGSGAKVPWQVAAYVTGQVANVLDFDDVCEFDNPGHPGIVYIPTALILGEALGSSGEEMLLAVIVGYETSMHIGKAVGSTMWKEGFLSSLPMGAAIVAAKLLHLDTGQTAGAMRLAGMWPWKSDHRKFDVDINFPLSDRKNNAGTRACFGIYHAYEAQAGLEGSPYFLDNCDFEKWYLAGGTLDGYDLFIAGPGKPYHIMDVSIKPTPSCSLSHPAVTALWKALDKQPVKEEDIEEIIFKGVKRLDRPQWTKMDNAQFSLYCVLSLAALGVEPGPQWYVNGRFDAPDVRALAKKIKLVNDPEAVKTEIQKCKVKAAVTVKFKDGTIKEAQITASKGSPGNPLTREEILAKFRSNTRALFSKSRVNKIIDTIMNLEKLPRVHDLSKLLISKKLKK